MRGFTGYPFIILFEAKDMKNNILIAVILLLCAAFSFAGCGSKELKLNVEYYYHSMTFEKAGDLKIEELAAFVPMGTDIKSIKDFEKMLRDNIENYSIDKKINNKTERFYLKTDITSVKIAETDLIIKRDDETISYSYTKDGNTYATELYDDFYFSKGALHYKLSFNDKFAVVYNYKAK